MPRRPQEHLDARRRQILDAARRCFIRNGFHATSMQDVLAEAIAEVASAFAAHDTDELPRLDDIVDLVLAVEKPPLAGSPESARLLVQIWSEALRSPALATQLTDVMAATRRVIGGLVTRYQDRGLLPADVPAEQVADVLIALVDGFMVQRAVHGHADPVAFRSGLRALMATPTS